MHSGDIRGVGGGWRGVGAPALCGWVTRAEGHKGATWEGALEGSSRGRRGLCPVRAGGGSFKGFTRTRAASGPEPCAVAPGEDGCAEREAGGWWGQPFTTRRAWGRAQRTEGSEQG